MIPLHTLTAVDVDGRYDYVECRLCGQRFTSPMAASRVPCSGVKEKEPCPSS